MGVASALLIGVAGGDGGAVEVQGDGWVSVAGVLNPVQPNRVCPTKSRARGHKHKQTHTHHTHTHTMRRHTHTPRTHTYH